MWEDPAIVNGGFPRLVVSGVDGGEIGGQVEEMGGGKGAGTGIGM